jgi:hypothetical protein
VYLFGSNPSADSWTTWTYDLADTDTLESVQWAQDQVGDAGLYAVALVSLRPYAPDGPASKGLIWLVGGDANDTLRTPREAIPHERMQELCGKRVLIA